MGAKASTNGNQSPRTFSNSSSSDVVSAGNNNATSFNFLRVHGVEVANDSRQRARSMSSVPDIQSGHHHHPNAYSNHPTHNSQPYHDVNGFQNAGAGGGPHFDLSSVNPEDGSNHDDNNPMLQGINALGLGRVYTAASLPSHIWSINGELTINILIQFPLVWLTMLARPLPTNDYAILQLQWRWPLAHVNHFLIHQNSLCDDFLHKSERHEWYFVSCDIAGRSYSTGHSLSFSPLSLKADSITIEHRERLSL